VTERTSIITTKTKALRATRRLRRFGILSYWDQASTSLVAYVNKHGEASNRKAMFRALETPCVLEDPS
jgi:uncharacterized protein YlbG (UPF0298 family)